MKLKENINLSDFIIKVRECCADVTFLSPEGDRLALKSALCQYIFASLQGQPALLNDAEILCEDSTDYELLRDYLT